MTTTTTMISDLPKELETEILSRVPAKSLAALKPTCKRWYALFRDPNFVKKILAKAANEVMVILMNSGVYSINIDLDSLQNMIAPTTELTGKLTTLDDSNFKVAEIFHCAGLLLCAAKKNSTVVVWNPLTGATRWIHPRKRYMSDDYYALGYKNNDTSSLHSYKILRFCRYYDSKKQLVYENEIYDFTSDSWRVLRDVTGGNCLIESHGVSLKGNAYWFATDEKDPTVIFILMFDFTTERFGRLRMPLVFYSDYYYVNESLTLSVIGEDKLALLHQGVDMMDTTDMRIWTTTETKLEDAEKDSWIDLMSVEFPNLRLPSVTSFLWDEKNQVAVCCDTDIGDDERVSIYIVGDAIHGTVYVEDVTTGTSLTWPFLFNYVPNLVHIQKDAPKRGKKRNLAARWAGQLRKRN